MTPTPITTADMTTRYFAGWQPLDDTYGGIRPREFDTRDEAVDFLCTGLARVADKIEEETGETGRTTSADSAIAALHAGSNYEECDETAYWVTWVTATDD